MNVKLVVVQGKPEGKEIPLRTPKFLIGRGTECHLRPNSELVSRHHCLLTLSDNTVRLRDLGSTNGTLVNGERIADEIVIQNDDLVQVGPLGFQIVMETVAASGPAAAPLAPLPAPAVVPEATTSRVGQLGSKDAKDSEIERWLVSDSTRALPDSGSGESSDAEMHSDTTVDRLDVRDTNTEITPLPPGNEPPQERTDKVVEIEGGGKLKIASAKHKIEKTTEDTSRAAADIIRRVMDRRLKK